ncbi:MAG: preprotein translocase subunit Sec61beta [Thermoprotei archaeon]|nr:MAG: preprotein translocase subunit Sec61beta [Thermoprotei archaeon]
MSSRRRRREVSPLTSAGLIRFYEGKEIEVIKISPYMLILFAAALIAFTAIAYLIGL